MKNEEAFALVSRTGTTLFFWLPVAVARRPEAPLPNRTSIESRRDPTAGDVVAVVLKTLASEYWG